MMYWQEKSGFSIISFTFIPKIFHKPYAGGWWERQYYKLRFSKGNKRHTIKGIKINEH